jgi:hypothetical protein
LDYFIGALATIIVVVIANRALRRPYSENKTIIRYSQSHVYSLMAPILDYVPSVKPLRPSQSSKYVESSYIKVMIVEKFAYWIKDNALYTAEVVEGEVDKTTTKQVDTMTMDRVELEKTMFIVEKLREGQDHDNGSAGKPKL